MERVLVYTVIPEEIMTAAIGGGSLFSTATSQSDPRRSGAGVAAISRPPRRSIGGHFTFHSERGRDLTV